MPKPNCSGRPSLKARRPLSWKSVPAPTNLLPLQTKMALWMAGGVRLGWLIDTRNRRVFIYRAGRDEPEILDDPETLDGEDVLPGFTFPARQYVFDLE